MDSSSTSRKSPSSPSAERVRQNHLDRNVSRGTSRREFLEAQAWENRMEDTDPTPVEVPPFYTRPATLKEELQRYVRFEVSRAAHSSGFETFEEADDFGIEDDDDLEDWDSEYQLTQLQEEEIMGYDNLDGDDNGEFKANGEIREQGGDGASADPEIGQSERANADDKDGAAVPRDGAP